jgi:hypothetical protein
MRESISVTDPTAPSRPREVSRRPWLERWMTVVRTIGNVQAWIILTLFYVVLITPIALVFKCLADPLRLRRRGATWQPLPSQYDQLPQAGEQS